MRWAATIGLLLATPVACSNGSEVGPPPAAPVDWHAFAAPRTPAGPAHTPTAKERAVAETYAAALGSPRMEQLAALLDEDAHFAFPGWNDARGRDRVVQAHDALFGAFDDRKVTTSRVWRTDSTQALEWTLTGAQSREFLGVAPTRKPVAFSGLTLLWTKDDGTISDVHVYLDVGVVKGQLGVGPKELVNLAPPTPYAGAPLVFEQTGSGTERSNVDLVRGQLDALEAKNEAAYTTSLADDVELYTPERTQPARGKDEVGRAYFKAMHKAIAQLDTTISAAWGITTFAIAEYWIAGEQVGPIGWIPTVRDRVIRLDVVDITEIREGQIARVWRFDNPAEILASP